MDSDPQIEALGPDWLIEPKLAILALIRANTKRMAKDVLTDQRLASGIGNYLACEILYRAGVHPAARWHTIDRLGRAKIADEAIIFLEQCMNHADHSHWKVFDKKGESCPACAAPIAYVKDGGGNAKRGSYYCPVCQPETQ